MPQRKGRRPKPAGPPAGAPESRPRRPGLPAPDTVVSETTLESPTGRKYRILRTDQQDAYDEPAAAASGEHTRPPKGRPARSKGKRRRKL
jgi:hypothetical protein